MYSETPLDIKKIIALLHTLSAFNNLLVCYKVYSSDPWGCLCTSGMYTEAYEDFSIDPAPCRKNPIKKQNCHTKFLAPTTRRKLK